MSWKKRGKKGWLGKKTAKELSEPTERNYAKAEVKQALQEELEGDDFRYPHYKASPNPEKKLEGRVKSIKNNIIQWERMEEQYKRRNSLLGKHLNWLKSWLDKTKTKLNNIKNKKL
jgi:hypothetical protein